MHPIVACFLILLTSVVLSGCRRTDTQVTITEIERQKTAVETLRNTVPQDTALTGYYFVLDPGHGDNDPGAIRTDKQKNGVLRHVSESALNIDITRRLAWYLKVRGASGVYITLGPDEIINAENDQYTYWEPSNPPSILKELKTLLPASRYAYWPLEMALTPRTEVANQKIRTYGRKNVIFISIHVDSTNKDVKGMRTYRYYGTTSALGHYIAIAAQKRGVARTLTKDKKEIDHFPTMQAGFVVIDPRFIYTKEKILIETTNIRNDSDFKKLCTAEGRESIAHTIGDGIILYRKAQK